MSEQGGIRLVLGSESPRRAQLLRQLHIEFEQIVSSATEPAPTGDDLGRQAIRCAQIKAQAVHELLGPPAEAPVIVVGADTMVFVDGTILGEPAGTTHAVCTGICLLGPGELEQTDSVFTEVWIKPLSAVDIETYVESGEPMDKAGAYAIQGLGARFIERISGCYYNVVGLPLARLTAMLTEAGYR